MAILVAFVAVVAVVAELAEPLILTAKEVIDPLAEFNGTAVVPIYSEELPKTPLGIVPDKLPAVRLVKLAPEPLNPVAVNTPVEGLYWSLVELVYSVDRFPLVWLANKG